MAKDNEIEEGRLVILAAEARKKFKLRPKRETVEAAKAREVASALTIEREGDKPLGSPNCVVRSVEYMEEKYGLTLGPSRETEMAIRRSRQQSAAALARLGPKRFG